ncbi:MAG: alcohol dehydrogenase [Conexibacter sp.]|nr:alcohol dehydrogenase [Conexibacter sp.]
MHAVQLTEYGVDNIELREALDPVPGEGEVLIATEAATINPADHMMVTGGMASFLPSTIAPPYTPGWDLAGTVVDVGAGTDPSLVGSRVAGFSNWVEEGRGTQASLVALPLANVAVAPDGLPASQLTTVGLNGLTAWASLEELGLTAGQTLVVVGAAGSVGGFALELAHSRGIRVVAAVSERDRDQMLARGASHVADREAGDLGAAVRKTLPEGADALLDTTSSLGGAGLAAIRDGGRYVTVTDGPPSERDINVTKAYGVANAEALGTLARMATDGSLSTPVAKVFAAADARAAYQEFASGSHRGRIVLTF